MTVIVLGGLTYGIRTLGDYEERIARDDARSAANRLTSSLSQHADVLGGLGAAFAAAGPDSARIGVAAAALGRRLGTFRHVWIADAGGRIVGELAGTAVVRPSTRDSAAVGGGLPALAEAIAVVRGSGSDVRVVAPSSLPSGEQGVLVARVVRGDSVAGFVAGFIPLTTVRREVVDGFVEGRMRLTVLSGADTVVTVWHRSAGRGTPPLGQDVALPGGGVWRVELVHRAEGDEARVSLLLISLGALLALALGLLYERRQTRRIAERSRELEHLSAELLRANRAKSEFLANVSHELRTPLNAIVGFVDLLRDGVYGELGPRQVGPVERIEASAKHLRVLVDQILDLAKMAAGRLEVHTEPVDLRPFVFDVASEVESLIAEKGLSLSLAVGATLPRVRTDPTHLRQILVNLLGNAVKFTEEGSVTVRGRLVGPEPKAALRTETPRPMRIGSAPAPAALRDQAPAREKTWVALQVADSGIGIPERDRERIFDEFEQVNAGPRGDSMRRGTGLGLAISRRLARLIGGDITVESEVGRGSVFTLWLPVDPADLRGDRAA